METLYPAVIHSPTRTCSNYHSYIWKIPITLQPQKNLICCGYARLNSKQFVASDIITLFANYYDIEDAPTVSRLKVAVQGQYYDTQIFELQGIKWYLRIYPDGTLKRTQGRTDLFLYLAALAPSLSAVAVKFKLYCIESKTSYSTTEQFTTQSCAWGWDGYNKQNLLKSDELTFGVDISLISIFDKSGNQLSDSEIKDMFGKPLKQEIKRKSKELDELTDIVKKMGNIEDKIDKMHKHNVLVMSELESLKKSIKNILSINNKMNMKDDMSASQQKVSLWLKNDVKLKQYFDIFIENGLDDLDILKLITMDTLNKIGIEKIGHQIKILHHVDQLKQKVSDNH